MEKLKKIPGLVALFMEELKEKNVPKEIIQKFENSENQIELILDLITQKKISVGVHYNLLNDISVLKKHNINFKASIIECSFAIDEYNSDKKLIKNTIKDFCTTNYIYENNKLTKEIKIYKKENKIEITDYISNTFYSYVDGQLKSKSEKNIDIEGYVYKSPNTVL